MNGMNRTIASSVRRRLGLLPAALTVVGLAFFGTGCSGDDTGPNPSGTLEATPVDIASTLPGRVLEVRTDEGDKVAKGDTLICMDTRLIALQRAQTAANRASLDARLRVAQDNLGQAKNTLALQDLTLQRTKTLAGQGSATQQQLDEIRTRRDVTAGQVSAAKHQIDAIMAEMAKLDAGLAVFDRQLQDGIITSPLDGTVLLRSAEPGEVKGVGATALRLADLSHLDLRVYLSVKDMAKVKLGQTVKVLVDALGDQPIEGTVDWISDEAEFTPKNVQTRKARAQLVYAIKVRVANPDGRLHIGMPAEMVLP